MAIENFTTYDETDEGGNVTVTAEKVSWDALSRAQTSHVSDSKGVNHFNGDFTHKFECRFLSRTGNPYLNFWALANAQLDFKALVDALADAEVFRQYQDGLSIRFIENGSPNSSATFTGSDSTYYYVTVSRDYDGGVNSTGQLTAEIHTDDYHPAGTHKDLLTVDGSAGEQNDFEFVFGLMSYDDGNPDHYGYGHTQNLDLGEEPPVGNAAIMTTNAGFWGPTF